MKKIEIFKQQYCMIVKSWLRSQLWLQKTVASRAAFDQVPLFQMDRSWSQSWAFRPEAESQHQLLHFSKSELKSEFEKFTRLAASSYQCYSYNIVNSIN